MSYLQKKEYNKYIFSYQAFMDANWAGDIEERKSTSDYLFKM